MGLQQLLQKENYLDFYRMNRYMYKIGFPLIKDDKIYNQIETFIKEKHKDNPLLLKTYDDDAYPADLFVKYGLSLPKSVLKEINAIKVKDNPFYQKLKEKINDYRTNSIKPIDNYWDIFEWFKPRRGKVIIMSVKANGINTRSFIYDENKDGNYQLACSSTRAREGEGWDITENLSRKYPKEMKIYSDLKGDIEDVKVVYGEAYVTSSALPLLREKYGKQDTWVNARSTALSILRVGIESEDYQYLKFKVFKISNLARTLSETLTKAKEIGFDVVPWIKIDANTVPESFEEFSVWLKETLERFSDIVDELDIECDGVVAEVDNQTEFMLEGEENQYSFGNIAIKVDRWASVYNESIIKDLEIEGKRGKFSVVAIIEPVIMPNGATARRVNCFNPDIIISNDLTIGSKIRFEYKSDANINLIY